MNYKSTLSRLWILLFGVALWLGSCAEDNTKSSFTLYYMSMNDIGQSMNAPLMNPTYHGATPSDFTIDKVTFDGSNVQNESFEIDPNNGAIKVSNTDNLALGVYKVTVSCVSGGSRYTFNDIFVFSLGKLYPESLEASPAVVSIPYPANQLDDNLVSQISTVGQCVTTTGFNVVQERGKEYFTITPQGEVTLNAKFKGDIPAGDYDLRIRVINKGGSAEYADVVKFKITSAPLELSYIISANKVEIGQTFESSAPSCTGSQDGLTYAIEEISPALTTSGGDINTIISIDPATGVIKAVDAQSKLAVGENYKVSIKATNDYGSKVFPESFTLQVVGFIQPVDNFSYDPFTITQLTPFTATKNSAFLGDDVIFEFVNLVPELQSELTLNAKTGDISAIKGNKIAVGDYTITIKATNAKGSATAPLALKVTANPNIFTRITYGNNIGIDAQSNANQFLFMSEADMKGFSMPTPQTDCTQPLTWSVKARQRMSGTTIDTGTGALTLGGYVKNNAGLVVVTATAGTGDEQFSLSVPVFFSFPNEYSGSKDQGLMVTYESFVFQCNPRKGGASAPVVVTTRATGAPYTDAFALEYSRTYTYYNLNGPDTHVDGQIDASSPPVPAATMFLYKMVEKWGKQFTPNVPVGTGSKDPYSYFPSKPAYTPDKALVYVNNADSKFRVVVNPGMWVDNEDVAANGVFFSQMTCLNSANIGKTGTIKADGQETFPLWIWFDEKF